jgi:hypothetical protein
MHLREGPESRAYSPIQGDVAWSVVGGMPYDHLRFPRRVGTCVRSCGGAKRWGRCRCHGERRSGDRSAHDGRRLLRQYLHWRWARHHFRRVRGTLQRIHWHPLRGLRRATGDHLRDHLRCYGRACGSCCWRRRTHHGGHAGCFRRRWRPGRRKAEVMSLTKRNKKWRCATTLGHTEVSKRPL